MTWFNAAWLYSAFQNTDIGSCCICSVTVSLHVPVALFSSSSHSSSVCAHMTWDGWGFPVLLKCQRAGLCSAAQNENNAKEQKGLGCSALIQVFIRFLFGCEKKHEVLFKKCEHLSQSGCVWICIFIAVVKEIFTHDKNECISLVIVILLKYSWSREQHCPVDRLFIFKKLESNVDSIQTYQHPHAKELDLIKAEFLKPAVNMDTFPAFRYLDSCGLQKHFRLCRSLSENWSYIHWLYGLNCYIQVRY